MAPVDERPLTFSVRTDASLNNSMKRWRGPGRRFKGKKGERKRLEVFSGFLDPAVEPYHRVHL